ncbi:MAG: rhomboid family intramembrane serine protease [Chthoniobacterales bacterium]
MQRNPRNQLLTDHWAIFGLIGLNVIASVTGFFVPWESLNFLKTIPSEVVATWQSLITGGFSMGSAIEFATLLSYAFFHADLEHLVFNLLYFWVFSFLVGELLGQRWVIAIYFVTAISGAVCFVIFNAESTIPMLGASGAVSGFEGAYLGLAIRSSIPPAFVWPLARPISPFTLGALAVIGVGLDLSGTINPGNSNTAFATHLGGFVAGVFLTSFVTPPARRATAR